MPTYDRPIWQLLEDAIRELSEVFTTEDVIRWFQSRYPKLKSATVRQHLLGMSVNSPTRKNMPGLLAHGSLYKIGRNRYTRYDPIRHGDFDDVGRQEGLTEFEGDSESLSTTPEILDEIAPEQAEFALEMHLEEFMERNWARIDFGMPLDLYSDADGTAGRQFPTDVGSIDFLCKRRDSGSFVVVELKKGKTSDAVVGQIQRYMGWVKQNLAAEGDTVSGLIIASKSDERLKFALLVAPNILLRIYRVNFELAAPEEANGR